MKTSKFFLSTLIAASAMTATAYAETPSTTSIDSIVAGKTVENTRPTSSYVLWVGGETGGEMSEAANWKKGTINGTEIMWGTENGTPNSAAGGQNGSLMVVGAGYKDANIVISGSVNTSDGGGIIVSGASNVVSVGLGTWAGSIQVDAGNTLNTTWSNLKEGAIVANGIVNVTSGNLNLDGAGERQWWVGAEGSINFSAATGLSNGTVMLSGEIDNSVPSLLNRTKEICIEEKKMVTFAVGGGLASGLENLSIGSIGSTSGVEISSVDSQDALTAENLYYVSRTSSGVSVFYTKNAASSPMSLTWDGADGATWTEYGTDWSSSGTKTSFVNGDSVVFEKTSSVSVAGDIVVGGLTLGSGVELTLGGSGRVSVEGLADNVVNLNGNGKVKIGEEVTLDLTYTGSPANTPIDATFVTGDGTLSVTKDTGAGTQHDRMLNISDDFKGTVKITGNYMQENLNLGGARALALDGVWFWSQNSANITKDVLFVGLNKNYINSGTIEFSGTVESVGVGSFTVEGGSAEFSGSMENVNLNISGGSATFSGSMENVNLNISGGSATISGSGSMTTLLETGGTVNVSGNATVEALRLNSGNLTVTGTMTITGASNNIESSKASFFLNNSGTSTMTVKDGGVLNVQSAGVSVRDGTGTLEIQAGGEVNFGQGLSATMHGTWGGLNVVLSGGTLNVGGSGIVKTNNSDINGFVHYNLNTGTLGSLADAWSSSIGFALGGAVTVDTTKKAINLSGKATATEYGSNVTLSGVLSDATDANGSIKKTGAGTLMLSGANTYSGGTTIEAGTLIAGSNSALGTNSVKISGGKLEVSSGVTVSNAIEIILNSAYTTEAAVQGAGTLDPSSVITVSGDLDALITLQRTVVQQYEYHLLNNNSLTTDGVTVTLSEELEKAILEKGWTYTLTDNGSTLTLTIPEPSAFGLLAGVGALALVASRRRRSRR